MFGTFTKFPSRTEVPLSYCCPGTAVWLFSNNQNLQLIENSLQQKEIVETGVCACAEAAKLGVAQRCDY